MSSSCVLVGGLQSGISKKFARSPPPMLNSTEIAVTYCVATTTKDDDDKEVYLSVYGARHEKAIIPFTVVVHISSIVKQVARFWIENTVPVDNSLGGTRLRELHEQRQPELAR